MVTGLFICPRLRFSATKQRLGEFVNAFPTPWFVAHEPNSALVRGSRTKLMNHATSRTSALVRGSRTRALTIHATSRTGDVAEKKPFISGNCINFAFVIIKNFELLNILAIRGLIFFVYRI